MSALLPILTVLMGGLTSGSQITVSEFPTDITFGAGALWILEWRTLSRVDPETSQVVARIPLPCPTRAVAAREGEVWVACQRNSLLKIDPSSNEITDTLRGRAHFLDLEAGGGRVWVLWTGGMATWIAEAESFHRDEQTGFRVGGVPRTLAKALTRRGAVLRKDRGKGPRMVGLAWAADSLWYMNSIKGWATRVYPDLGEITDEWITLPEGATRIVSGTEAVWVVDRLDGAVHQYDPISGELLATIPVGSEPTDGVFQDGALWVAIPFDGSISRVDVTTHSMAALKPEGPLVPLFLAAGGESIWTATVEKRIVELYPAGARPAREAPGDRSTVPLQCLEAADLAADSLVRNYPSSPAFEGNLEGRVVQVIGVGDQGWALVGHNSDAHQSLSLVRLDSAGRIVWQTNFGGAERSQAVGAVTLPDGGFMVAANETSGDESPWHILLARVSALGEILWEERLTANGESRFIHQMITLADGGLALAGAAVRQDSKRSSAYLSVVDADGGISWERHFDEIEAAVRLSAAKDSGLVLVGPPPNQVSVRMLAVGPEGDLLWSGIVLPAAASATDLISDGDTGWFLAADSELWADRGYLLHLDSQGDVLWCRRLGAYNATWWRWGLQRLNDGSVMAFGVGKWYVSFIGLKGKLNVARVAADGELLSETVLDGFAVRHLVGVQTDSEGRITVFDTKYWTCKRAFKKSSRHGPRVQLCSGPVNRTRKVGLNSDGVVVEW